MTMFWFFLASFLSPQVTVLGHPAPVLAFQVQPGQIKTRGTRGVHLSLTQKFMWEFAQPVELQTGS